MNYLKKNCNHHVYKFGEHFFLFYHKNLKENNFEFNGLFRNICYFLDNIIKVNENIQRRINDNRDRLWKNKMKLKAIFFSVATL